MLELPARWGEPLAALADVDAELAAGARTDIVLLPEAALTGYVSPGGDADLRAFAEPHDGPVAARAAQVAVARGVTLVAPMIVREEGSFFNAMVAFAADGTRVFSYAKRHPWTPETWATAGPAPAPVVRIGGHAVTTCICFDIHFVSHDAAAALDASDVLLFPSAWVDDGPDDLRADILPRLARRHRITIVNANWGPGAVRIPGQGGSRVIAADGRALLRTETSWSSPARIVRADVTLELPARAL